MNYLMLSTDLSSAIVELKKTAAAR
jgi:hypothetical protein